MHWIARRFLVVSPLAAENFLRSLSSRILLFWSRMFASARSWYSPTWRAERSKSAGSIWPFVGPSANISSVGHHLVTNPQLCLTMVMSMATLPSSVLETEDMEVRLSYKLLQSVTLIMGPAWFHHEVSNHWSSLLVLSADVSCQWLCLFSGRTCLQLPRQPSATSTH